MGELSVKRALIGAGFRALSFSELHRLTPARFRGRGVILTLHRVRPWRPATPGYAPNALLEVTPEFLEAALMRMKKLGFEWVALEDVPARLADEKAPRFAALTFDDGYADFVDHALPVLERFDAPATLFLCPGMIEPGARLWWLELEEAIRRLDAVESLGERFFARTAAEKSQVFERIYWRLRALTEADLLAACEKLAKAAGVADAELRENLFLDWGALQKLAARPRIAFGAHSLTHVRLAQWPESFAREEVVGSKAVLEARLQRPIDAFCYPVGDPTSAGKREFALAKEAGFKLAVTTRPGLAFPEHLSHLFALPRVSLNGLWQNVGYLDVLISGAAFALWNLGRRVDAD